MAWLITSLEIAANVSAAAATDFVTESLPLILIENLFVTLFRRVVFRHFSTSHRRHFSAATTTTTNINAAAKVDLAGPPH